MTQLEPSALWQNIGEHHVLALKNPWYAMLVELQTSFDHLTHQFWRTAGAKSLHLPVTTGSISSPMGAGSDSKPVEVTLSGARTYLADSMQFMLEFGCRLADSDCYYVMPSFRGEDTDARHLSEFFHSEAELIGDLDRTIDTVERYLVHLAQGMLEEQGDLILRAAGTTAHVESLAAGGCFERLTFDEAERVLGGEGINDHGDWRDLSNAAEQRLLEVVGPFTWVTHWDHLSVPFYQAYADDDRRSALNADLLLGIGETVGAGQRHESADQVLAALEHHEVAPESYEWYCQMRESALLQTSGFGLGVERFFLWLTRHTDIRDMQILPRRTGLAVTP